MMTIKNSLFSILTALCVIAATSVHAQDLKIGLVDMQKALNSYNETAVQTEKINGRAKALKEESDKHVEELKGLIEKIKAISQEAQDTEKNEATRQKSVEKLDEYRLIYMEKQKIAAEAGERANAELAKRRSDMEVGLVTEINKVMQAMAKEKDLDLVFDKSFLPRANKFIVQVSPNVLDMTDEIVTILNSQ